ncbi:aldo/keto reductase [Herbaspirillum sp. RTI4]|uniref:aldo/keto reductase n=1 Tax=Herbaspirillum sp. RTI4 TaxID=3048640 RepID=UPI002AB43DB5|nr:aldo/keto reductase [Herbaspirillum sp. RTI4]MDY7578773.1 aldo/keto reductase [Herbaspirillum sp. RTI4]MEA9982307.1 aldo/keto reductase [Herbaspirillum sp. RTI4]
MKTNARKQLGKTDLQTTALSMGTAGLAGLYHGVPFDDAIAALQAAWDAGMRYFDTAPYYGYGKSEHRVGHVLRNFLQYAERSEFVLSTKVGRILKSRSRPGAQPRDINDGWNNPFPFEPVYDYSYSGVMRSFEDSLQRLGMAHIDILLVHDIGSATHGELQAQYWQQLTGGGGFRALDELRRSGTISAVGLGVNETDVVMAAMQEFDLDCCLLAGRYTLLEQQALDQFMPECSQRKVSILLGGIFNSGILAKGMSDSKGLTYNYGPVPPAVISRVKQLDAVCLEFDVSLAAAALQFPYAHPQVASIIAGGRNAQEVNENTRSFRQLIPDEFWHALQSRGLLHAAAPLPVGKK